ncbi:hypothetical protein SETIT_J001200v2 [Setaria italica]|uniref:Agenet domain-containing protein n=3 Tax=Setaria TaxID=4554 RepID=K3Z2A0_SETIT|nr:hypothetical protein SETIT_J001200v2 [Setaria italica]TKW14584.1 hypothetical protein SEVIR_5G177530v2 [Setaria viridis]TKW14586.1 hypothetical protein SEVIR_5G177530v2 [Setaria viridis]
MIMVRPTFPQWYLEHEKPKELPKANVVAIVSSPWKVGDLVEWWYTDCYWTGKIVELLGDDKVKIALHEEPIGEGGYYDAYCKDLRPALDWSLGKSWSVPLSQGNGKSWYTAQLIIQSTDSGSSSSDEDIEQSCDCEEVQKCLDRPSDLPAEAMGSGTKLSANVSDEVFINNQGHGKEESPECLNGASNMPQEVTDSKGELPPNQNGHCCIKSETNSPIAKQGESPEALSDGKSSPISLKRQKTSSGDISVEAPPDSVDYSIMKLEKVANKIRRLESLLLSVGSPPSKVAKPSWKFLEEDASHK